MERAMAENRPPNWPSYLERLTSAPEVDGLERDEAIEALREWFFENFEDPVEHTPYESAEGGYQYIWGGPWETGDIFEHVYGDSISEELKAAVVSSLEDSTDVWVPNLSRVNILDEDEQSAEEAYAKMQEHVRALEELLSQVLQAPPAVLVTTTLPRLWKMRHSMRLTPAS
jgi:hypothetical protein